MRKLVTLTTAVVVLLAAVAVALAANTQSLDTKISSTRSGTKAKPKIVSLTTTVTTGTTDGSKPSPSTKVVLIVPEGIQLNFGLFKKCSKATLESVGPDGCVKGSQVGSGSSTVDARPVIPTDLKAVVTAFSGGPDKLELYAKADVGQPIVIEGKLTKSGSRKKKLTFKVPPLPTVPGSPNASIKEFIVKLDATVRKSGRKRGVIETTKCPGGKWKTLGEFDFESGEHLTASDVIRCRQGR